MFAAVAWAIIYAAPDSNPHESLPAFDEQAFRDSDCGGGGLCCDFCQGANWGCFSKSGLVKLLKVRVVVLASSLLSGAEELTC